MTPKTYTKEDVEKAEERGEIRGGTNYQLANLTNSIRDIVINVEKINDNLGEKIDDIVSGLSEIKEQKVDKSEFSEWQKVYAKDKKDQDNLYKKLERKVYAGSIVLMTALTTLEMLQKFNII